MDKKKSVIMFVTLFLLSIGLVLANVDFYEEINFKKIYSVDEIISGKINLSVEGEDLDSEIMSSLDDDTISLEDFLENNSVVYDCVPEDCSNGYEVSGSGSGSKSIPVSSIGKKYFGFYLEDDREGDVEIKSLSFDISSDFGEVNSVPLKLEFFERSVWEFREYSNDYSRRTSYGCYSSSTSHEVKELDDARFCEKVYIGETTKVKVGADISGSGSNELEMRVFDVFSNEKGSCSISLSDNSCIVDLIDSEEVFSEGDYYVCVEIEGESDLTILSETSGEKCGWYQVPSSSFNIPSTLPRDYPIFAKTPKYAGARDVKINSSVVSNLVFDMNSLLNQKYDNCSDGCVFPVSVEGVSQNFEISNVKFEYAFPSEQSETDGKVYNLNMIPAKVDYSGILDLKFTDFKVGGKGKKTFRLYFNDDELFQEGIDVSGGVVIKSVFPRKLPAGIQLKFFANVGDKDSVESYLWDFGDGTVIETVNASAWHFYGNISNYVLTLNVTDDNGLVTSKKFEITTYSPEDFINSSLSDKKQTLNYFIREVNKVPSWYQEEIEKLSKIGFYQSELTRLEKKFNNSYADDDFLEIALDLNNLDVPSSILKDSSSFPLLVDFNEINPEPVQIIAGGSVDSFGDYKNSIFQWQRKNVEVDVSLNRIFIVKDSGEQGDVLSVYSLNVKLNSNDESYFVIQKPWEDLYFNNQDNSMRKAGDSGAVILNGNEEKKFEFYFIGEEDVVMYVSPKLSLLPTDVTIAACNFNNACEKDKGEDSDNCRDDCTPWGMILFWVLLVLFLGLIAYIALQMWYKAKYETHLFKDRKQLFNLVMFITNARAKGMDDYKIRQILRKHHWSNEKITYALKKSRGQRTGMFEIIPIEKIFAWRRKKIAKERIEARRMVVTHHPVHYRPNINK